MSATTRKKKILIGLLPKEETYSIVKVVHFLENEDGPRIIKCHNCNKTIINIATVKNSKGKEFEVGLDCAATLSGMNLTELEKYEKLIKMGVSARNSIKNCIKSRPNLEHIVKVHTFDTEDNYFKEIGAGGYIVYRKYSKHFMQETYGNFSKMAWENVIYPYIKDLVTPEEIVKDAVFYKSPYDDNK